MRRKYSCYNTARYGKTAITTRYQLSLQAIILLLLPILVSAAWFKWGGTDALDDAFISFNYSLNVSEGNGIVYYPGGEHTQGYTNFLFMILVAFGLLLDVFPPDFAWMLNTLGLLMIGLSMRVLAGRLFGRQAAWLALLSVPIFLHDPSLWNLSTGLETVFWTGLVFVTAALVMKYVGQPDHRLLAAIVLTSFLAGLTRPDSGIFIAVWFLYMLIAVTPRRPVIIAGAVLGGISLIYIGWLQWYFVDFLPNPFYIKVVEGGPLPGWDYVRGYLESYATLLAVTVIALATVFRRDWRTLFPYAVVFLLLPFYTYSQPLIGHHYRFLFPVTCLILFLGAAGMAKLLLLLKDRFTASPKPLWAVAVVAAALMSYLLLWNTHIYTWQLLDARLDDPALRATPIDRNAERGKRFARVPGIEDVMIAYGDAGQVAYYSRARFLDMGGLNENTIAREGTENGGGWVIDYILQDQKPDVIGVFTFHDGRVEGTFHGPLTGWLSDLVVEPEFVEDYEYLGGYVHSSVTVLNWFVRSDSPHIDDLRAVVGAEADIEYLDVRPRSG